MSSQGVIDHLQVAVNNSSLAYVTTKPKDSNHTISFMNPDGSISNMPRVSELEALGVSISAVGAFDTSVVARIAAASRAYYAKKTYFNCKAISTAENREHSSTIIPCQLSCLGAERMRGRVKCFGCCGGGCHK